MLHKLKVVVFYFFLTMLFGGCNENYTPKPRGYFRIAFPNKQYKVIDSLSAYTLHVPEYSRLVQHPNQEHSQWYNLEFPRFNATLHLSFYGIDNNLNQMLEDSRELAFKHSVKADAIDDKLFINAPKEVYGTMFEIKGNAASPNQFYLTDSSRYFLRGSLYFNNFPNRDSLNPVIDFLQQDINYLIEHFEWKE